MKKNKNLLGKYVDICTDFGMKLYFGPGLGKKNLLNFLNCLFEEKKVFVELEYRQTERNGRQKHDRKVIFDLYCTCDDGSHVIIEMQQVLQEFIMDRSVYYTAQVISGLLEKGTKGNTYELPEVYFIGILNFVPAKDVTGRYHRNIALYDTESGEIFYDKLGYKFLVLPNFNKPVSKIVDTLDMWMYVFTHINKLDEFPKFLDKRIFQLIFEIGEVGNLNSSDMNAYESSLKNKRDLEAVRMTQVRQLERAREELERAKEEVREEERAKAEGQKLKSALSFKKMGIPTEDIAEGLGLTIEQVEELK